MGTCWEPIQELDVKGFEIVTNQPCLRVLNQFWSVWELPDGLNALYSCSNNLLVSLVPPELPGRDPGQQWQFGCPEN